ncbi:MAG: hypothetical protein FJ276_29825, partial [Planctomycetes bacterium]|nr:hypothetical protein [Planctomycetota bacterium]
MIWRTLFRRTFLGGDRDLATGATAGSFLDLAELEDRILMSAAPMAPDAASDVELEEPADAVIDIADAAL